MLFAFIFACFIYTHREEVEKGIVLLKAASIFFRENWSVLFIPITAFYYYCNATGWVSATGVSDSTGGFRNSGTISAGNPSDRATCSNAIDTDYSSFGTAFANTTNYTYIAIRRTQNNLITKPVENLISISGASQSFILSDDYIKLHGISAPPITCDATVDGAIYYDSDVKYHCSCNAVNWVRMSDPTDQTGCS